MVLKCKGGADTEDNLIVVCPTCHRKIHQAPQMYTPKRLKMCKEKLINIYGEWIVKEWTRNNRNRSL
ncbi:MAG: HNH endonuclease signature motif containing protein [bacterium]